MGLHRRKIEVDRSPERISGMTFFVENDRLSEGVGTIRPFPIEGKVTK